MSRRPGLSRRRLMGAGAAAVAALAAPPGAGPARAALAGAGRPVAGYGPLRPDPDGRLDLPAGFGYRVLSRVGDPMDDGLVVPGLADGMHAFAGPDGTTVLLRNHELDVGAREHAFAARGAVSDAVRARMHDAAVGAGGVTTVLVESSGQRVRSQFLSLAGTLRNCAGGATPWGSWLSCEESVVAAGERGAARDHGFVFEVDAAARAIVPARPLVAMGRFMREAVAVDPATGIVYQSEDRPDGLFYRFLPREPGTLAAGGRLQALALSGLEGRSTGNRGRVRVPAREPRPVHWVDLDDPAAPGDDLRRRGREAGASTFVRGEGLAVERTGDGTSIWLVCTEGGERGLGQIWRCRAPAHGGDSDSARGAAGSAAQAAGAGTLELFVEPRHPSLMDQGDNLALAPNGDLLVCEDNPRLQRIVGVTPHGGLYTLAANPRGDSEFAGATFAPGGRVLFVNLQRPGLTLAIRGPWSERTGR